jgi:acyl-CoA thioesterase-1
MTLWRGVVVAGVLAIASCASPAPREAPAHDAAAPAIARDEASARPRLVVLGDSLTAGLGLATTEAYPALLQARMDEAGLPFEVINAGVSGDTTAGGLSRLEWALAGDVRVLIVALGGNDGLRGLPVEEMRRNLTSIIGRAKARRISVLLAGMEAPPNFGEDYTSRFRQVFADVAREANVTFVPFLLEGVAGVPSLNQRDGIHPTADGARVIAETIWAALEPLLDQARAS